MKKYFNYIMLAGCFSLSLVACKKEEFIEINTDPNTLYTIAPKEQFLTATVYAHDNNRDWFYDYYRRIMPWMQYITPVNGNAVSFLQDIGNFNQKYGNFYGRVGNGYQDVIYLINELPDEQRATMEHLKQMAMIAKAQYAFSVTEIVGSMPYTEAFKARTENLLTPKYESQEELFTILDNEVKAAIGILKTAQSVPQEPIGAYDQYFKGDVTKWVKAGNALRLRMATRLQKRNPAKMQAIAQEVMADANNLMSSNADNWGLTTRAQFSAGGDWDPNGQGVMRASKPIVDFMVEKSDPRLRIFYTQNEYSRENFDLAIAQGKLSPSATFNARRYVGSFTSPDAAILNVRYYTQRELNLGTVHLPVGGLTPDRFLDTLSNIQRRLFYPSANAGDGTHYFGVITYAEFALTVAELAARNVITANAEQWYNNGVTASIQHYNTIGAAAKLEDYVAITPAEITAYLAMPEIKYNAATGVEQAAIQQYLHYYKQPNEAWSLYKRTGLPNATTIIELPAFVSQGVVSGIPRRAALSFPSVTSLNFANAQAAIDDMADDAGFGQGPSDMFGRVWWDMP